MLKTIYLLNIDDYAPDLTAITYPSIEYYARRIGANIYVINERKFPEWPIVYEKLQIHELAAERGDDWALYIDSDTLIHPELPDITELLPMDTVAHNGNDFSPVRFTEDHYFRRDGRHIGSCNWFTVASSWCLDVWRPLDDMEPKDVEARIHLTLSESRILEPAHLSDDFALSRNIARFGLKFTTLRDLWTQAGLIAPEFLFHQYLNSIEEKIAGMHTTIERWENPDWKPS